MNGPLPPQTLCNCIWRHCGIGISFEGWERFLVTCYCTSQLFTYGTTGHGGVRWITKAAVRTYSLLSILIRQSMTETFDNSSLGAVKFVEIIQLPYSQAISTFVINRNLGTRWNKELFKGLTDLWGLT
jgi:hypothetical protein